MRHVLSLIAVSSFITTLVSSSPALAAEYQNASEVRAAFAAAQDSISISSEGLHIGKEWTCEIYNAGTVDPSDPFADRYAEVHMDRIAFKKTATGLIDSFFLVKPQTPETFRYNDSSLSAFKFENDLTSADEPPESVSYMTYKLNGEKLFFELAQVDTGIYSRSYESPFQLPSIGAGQGATARRYGACKLASDIQLDPALHRKPLNAVQSSCKMVVDEDFVSPSFVQKATEMGVQLIARPKSDRYMMAGDLVAVLNSSGIVDNMQFATARISEVDGIFNRFQHHTEPSDIRASYSRDVVVVGVRTPYVSTASHANDVKLVERARLKLLESLVDCKSQAPGTQGWEEL